MVDQQRSLTFKAIWGLVSDQLENLARMLAGLVVTPIITRLLGQEMFGAWSMINQLTGFLALGNLRLSTTVKLYIANEQHLIDYSRKRRMVGASLVGALLSAPLIVAGTSFIVGMRSALFKLDVEYIDAIGVTIGITGCLLLVTQFLSIPGNILRAENQDYRAVGIKALSVIATALMTIIFIYNGCGLPGMAWANLVGYLLLGGIQTYLAFRYIPWLGLEWPTRVELGGYSGNSLWLVVGSLGQLLVSGIDYILAGVFLSPSHAAVYTTTAALGRLLMSPLLGLATAANSGLAGLCASGQFKRVAQVRSEYYQLGTLAGGVVGCLVLSLNASFIAAWVGPSFNGGVALTCLIIFHGWLSGISQLDGCLFDGLMAVRKRAIIHIFSGSLGVGISLVLAQRCGVVGIAIGSLAARLIILFWQNAYLKSRGLSMPLRRLLPPRLLIVIALVWAAAIFSSRLAPVSGGGVYVWMTLTGLGVVLFLFGTVLIVIIGLEPNTRRSLITRASHQFGAVRCFTLRKPK